MSTRTRARLLFFARAWEKLAWWLDGLASKAYRRSFRLEGRATAKARLDEEYELMTGQML